MNWNPITRRHFLQGAGAATLMLPFLPSLLVRKAFAAAAPQKNFIAIGAYNGLYRMYGPRSELNPPLPMDLRQATGFTATALPGKHTIYSRSLESLKDSQGKISTIIDGSFKDILPKMNMLEGFDYPHQGSNHHRGNFGNMAEVIGGSTGNKPVASIEHVMANSLSFYKNPNLRNRTVVWSANPEDNQEYGSAFRYKDPTNPTKDANIEYAPNFSNVATLWNTFFGNSSGQSSLKTTLVDQILTDYKSLRSSPKLGSEDRGRLDRHIAHLQETQRRVNTVVGACNQGARPTNPSDRKLILTAMNSVIVSLISCGLCHAFQGYTNSLVSSDPESYHDWSHEGNPGSTTPNAAYLALLDHNTSIMKDMCLDLALKLEALGLLDNSLIACVQEHSMEGHESSTCPIITIGGAGGALKTGQYINYRNFTVADDNPGIPVNWALATFLRAMDVPPAEFEALNHAVDADPWFTVSGRLTGYGATKANGGDAENGRWMRDHYKSTWAGTDLSAWLPLITP